MIAWLKGTLLQRHPARLVLDVNGVGYELQVTVPTYAQLSTVGAPVALFVHTHVRDDAIQLFGFAAASEKQLFERLITVNGVGPKLALAILSGLPADALATAIRNADHARLTAVPGVGRKTAERLVLELRDKIASAPVSEAAVPTAGSLADDVLSALVNLGYPAAAASQTVQRVLRAEPAASFDELFLRCMKAL